MHIPILLLHNHFVLFKKLRINTIQTIQVHISFQWYQNYFFQSIILFTQYIQIPIHRRNGCGGVKWVCPFQRITYQRDSNYSSAHIISMVSKLFLSVNYTFHSIYSNTNPLMKWLWWSKMGVCTSTHPKCVKIIFFVNCV